jgi:polysaccharide biosynthesis/export protein VpsN
MLKKLAVWAIGLELFLLAGGCGNPFISKKPVVEVPSLQVIAPSYQVGPNDALRIEVFDEPDLLTESTVSGHGTIKFPLLGELRVAGMTVKDVEDVLTQRLEAGYLKSPKVTVSILRYRNFYVSGEARNPGAFPYQEGITVLKAITLAGGWTERAVKNEAKMLRMVNGQQEILNVGMEEIIQPDDIIIVPESFF